MIPEFRLDFKNKNLTQSMSVLKTQITTSAIRNRLAVMCQVHVKTRSTHPSIHCMWIRYKSTTALYFSSH